MKKIFHVYFCIIKSPESLQFHDLWDRNSVYSYWIMVKHIIMLHVYSCNTCKYVDRDAFYMSLTLKKESRSGLEGEGQEGDCCNYLLLSGHLSIYSTLTAIVFRVYTCNVKPSSALFYEPFWQDINVKSFILGWLLLFFLRFYNFLVLATVRYYYCHFLMIFVC